MAGDEVIVTFQGQTFKVDRAKLAENMRHYSSVAEAHEMRPGEKTAELFPPNEELSFDEIALGFAIIYGGKRVP